MTADTHYSSGAATAPHGRRISINVSAAVVAASVWLLAAPGASAEAAADSPPLRWSVATLLPPGALYAVVSGDPTASGECTLLISMPNGYRFPPHSHPGDEHVVVVKEGTLLVGTGDRIDARQSRALAVGDSSTAPAGMHHFSIAKGRTMLLVTFMGPYTITYVHAEDAPRPRVFPFGY